MLGNLKLIELFVCLVPTVLTIFTPVFKRPNNATNLEGNAVAGEVSTSQGSTECEICTGTSYAHELRTFCNSPCEAGFYCEFGIKKQCKDGWKSASDQSNCEICEAGTREVSWTSCEICSDGTVSTNGSNSCQPCGNGTYADEDHKNCIFCEAGLFCRDGKKYQCPEGSVSNIGESTCFFCNETFYANPSQNECILCKPGHWCANGTLIQCSLDTVATNYGSIKCNECDIGTHSNSQRTQCISCSEGSISLNRSCVLCNETQYANSNGTECIDCEAGSYCTLGLKETCQDGSFSEDAQSNCTICGSGSYGNLTHCRPCESGYFCDGNLGLMKECESGWVSEEQSVECEECVAGTFENLHLTCEQCEEGMVSFAGSSSCDLCPSKSYANEGKQCLECEAGSYCDGFDGLMHECASGWISNVSASSCEICIAGTMEIYHTSCVPCSNSTYSIPGSQNCSTCPSTKYVKDRSSCLLCTAGKFCMGDGFERECDDGYWSSAGSKKCERCEEGKYAVEAQYCENCEAGYYCKNGTRFKCDLGYVSEPQSVRCEVCPPNEYSRDNDCILCPEYCECIDGIKYHVPPFECYGFLSNDTQLVCSSRGKCINDSECSCDVGSLGDWCQDEHTSPTVSVSWPYVIGACSSGTVHAECKGYGVKLFWESLYFEFDTFPFHFIPTELPPGVYSISAWCEDYWSRTSENVTFSLEKLSYDFPLVQVSPQYDIFVFANSRSEKLEGSLQTSCEVNEDDYSFVWSQIEPISHAIDFEGIDIRSRGIIFHNGFPPHESAHTIRLSVDSPIGLSFVDVVVNVILRDLVAMTDDSSRSVPIGSEIFVDASNSYDPELTPSEELFDWKLLKGSSRVDISDELLPSEDDRSAHFIPSEVDEYLLEMKYSKDERSSYVVLLYDAFVLIDDYAPKIWIDAHQHPVGYNEKVTLVAHIEEHEKNNEVKFLWQTQDLFPLNDFVLSENLQSLVLTLKPGAVTKTSNFRLRATYKSTVVYASTIIEVNDGPPRLGTVDIYPSAANVLDKFRISISDWQDNSLPLSYKVYYTHCISLQEKIVKDWGPESTFSFSISSQGCRMFDYRINLTVLISDYFGAVTNVVSEIQVFPSDFGDVVEFLKFALDLMRTPLSVYESFHYFLSNRFDLMFQFFNLKSPDCFSLSLQEQLCLSVEECESSNIFETEKSLVNSFISSCLELFSQYMNLFFLDVQFSSMIELFKISTEVILESDRNIQNATILFLNEIFEELYIKLELNDLNTFWQINEWLTGYVSKSDTYVRTFSILKLFLEKLALYEKNIYLPTSEERSPIQYDYEKDYSSGYIENAKLRIVEKVLSTPGGIEVIIPSEISFGFGFFDIVNTVIFSLENTNQTEIGVFFFGEGEFTKEFNSPLVIRFPFPEVLPREIKGWKNSIKCVANDLVVSETSESKICESEVIVVEDDKIIECKCKSINKIYGVSIDRMKDSTKLPGKKLFSNPAILVATILGPTLIILATFLLVVFTVVIIACIIVRRKKRKLQTITSVESFSDGVELNDGLYSEGTQVEMNEYVAGHIEAELPIQEVSTKFNKMTVKEIMNETNNEEKEPKLDEEGNQNQEQLPLMQQMWDDGNVKFDPVY